MKMKVEDKAVKKTEEVEEEMVEGAVVEAVASSPFAKAAASVRPGTLSLVIKQDEPVKENAKTTEDVARDLFESPSNIARTSFENHSNSFGTCLNIFRKSGEIV